METSEPSPPTGRRVALVTGASRGIGRAIALALGRAGYAVAVTARTVTEDQAPVGVGGSLQRTVADVEAGGGQAFPLRMDLLDLDGLAPVVDAVVDRWGRLDVLVNNAIYVGPQNDRRFLDVDPVELERRITGDLTAQLLLLQRAARTMVGQGGGTIVNISSGAGTSNPPAPVDEGGWALAYGCAKGGFHRAAGVIAKELGPQGIRCYNVQPGFVATERVRATPGLGHIAQRGKDPSVVGAAVAWLLAQPEGTVANGRTLVVDDVMDRLGDTGA